jgi:hypothetical protein
MVCILYHPSPSTKKAPNHRVSPMCPFRILRKSSNASVQ